jgi:hypothetical protein
MIDIWFMPPSAWPLVPSQSTHMSPSTSPVSSSLALCLPLKELSAGPYVGVTVTCQPSSPTWCAQSRVGHGSPPGTRLHRSPSIAWSAASRACYPMHGQRQLAGHHAREQPKQQLAGRSCRPRVSSSRQPRSPAASACEQQLTALRTPRARARGAHHRHIRELLDIRRTWGNWSTQVRVRKRKKEKKRGSCVASDIRR